MIIYHFLFTGKTTTIYITPRAREIDDSGRLLTESQRVCRLSEDNHQLKIFKVYTQEACLLECKIEIAYQRCGCMPWFYPLRLSVSCCICLLAFEF